jgi:MFS family permease
MSEPAAQGAIALLRTNRNLLRFILGRVLLNCANHMETVAIGWVVYNLTDSAASLGYVGLAEFLPSVVLVLITGHVADRVERRLILSIAMAVQGACAGAFTLLVAFGTEMVWPFYLVLVLLGSARAFAFPAFNALLPNLVDRAIFPRAVALSSSSNQLSTIVGPALGGIGLTFSESGVLGAACVLAFCAAFAMFGLRGIARPARVAEGNAWERILAGFSYIRSNQLILGAISLDLFAVLLGGVTALLPIFARDILMAGPTELGLLRSAPAVGAALVGLTLAHRPLGNRVGLKMLGCVALFGFATILFAYSENLLLSIAAMVILGGADMVSVVIRQTMVQLATPDNMRGRVAAVHGVFVGASNDLGQFESGITAEWLGAVRAAALGGVGTIVVVLLWARLFPALRNADTFADLSKQKEG